MLSASSPAVPARSEVVLSQLDSVLQVEYITVASYIFFLRDTKENKEPCEIWANTNAGKSVRVLGTLSYFTF